MQKSKTKATLLLLSLMMAATMFVSMPSLAFAATGLAEIDVSDFVGSLSSSDNSAMVATESQWNYSTFSQTLELSTVGGNYRLTGTNNSIVVNASGASNASITFDSLHVAAPGNPSTTPAAYVNGNNMTITLVGASSISATDGSAFQHSAVSGCTITSSAAGTLQVVCNTANQAGFVYNDHPLNIFGNATVNVQAAADAYGLKGYYAGGSYTINVSTNAALNVSAGTAIWASDITLFVNGAVSFVGSSATSGFGYGILAGNEITLSGNGNVAANGNAQAISTSRNVLMGDGITLSVTNNSSVQEACSMTASNSSSTALWTLTDAAFVGGTGASDTTIDVVVDPGDTGVIKRQAASTVPVCKNVQTNVEYTTLAAAVLDVVSGQTILLLGDVDESYNMTIETTHISIDMAGFDITLNTGEIEVKWGRSLTIVNGGTIQAKSMIVVIGSTVNISANTDFDSWVDVDRSTLSIVGDTISAGYIGGGGSTIRLTGDVYSMVWARGDTTAIVIGNIIAPEDAVKTDYFTSIVEVTGNVTAGRRGVHNTDGKTIIHGNVVAGTYGVEARDSYSDTTIYGSVTAGENGVFAYWGAVVEVKSGITTTNTTTPDLFSAVQANDDAKVTVSGGITTTGNGVTAFCDSGSEVTVVVNGDIKADFYGVWAAHPETTVTVNGSITAKDTGVLSSNGSKVIVNGTITAPRYVVLRNMAGGAGGLIIKTAAQNDTSSSRAGYKQYSGGDPLSWVWVANNPAGTPPTVRTPGTTTPATGDTVAMLLPMATFTLLLVAFVNSKKRRVTQ